jgi:hypothetical protein
LNLFISRTFSVTEREIRRGTNEKNSSNVIGIIRDFSNPSIETPIDAKFFGNQSKHFFLSQKNLFL